MPFNIKRHYVDVIYEVCSSLSKEKSYKISNTYAFILLKLIHYSKSKKCKNGYIYYSNDSIAKHTKILESTIEKAIPKLAKIGFITLSHTYFTGANKPKTFRTITINWDFLEKIYHEMDKPAESEDDSTNEYVDFVEDLGISAKEKSDEINDSEKAILNNHERFKNIDFNDYDIYGKEVKKDEIIDRVHEIFEELPKDSEIISGNEKLDYTLVRSEISEAYIDLMKGNYTNYMKFSNMEGKELLKKNSFKNYIEKRNIIAHIESLFYNSN